MTTTPADEAGRKEKDKEESAYSGHETFIKERYGIDVNLSSLAAWATARGKEVREKKIAAAKAAERESSQ